jgi:molybdopterin converting factor small subunit
MPKLRIPTALRAFTDRKSSVEVSGATVGETVTALAELYPDIRGHLYEDTGELRSFINIFVGDTNVKATGGLATPVAPDSEVLLVPAIAGGAA